MRKMKLKIIVKMRKRDSFMDNNEVDCNDDEYEDIGKVREILRMDKKMRKTRIDEEDETEYNSEDEEKG